MDSEMDSELIALLKRLEIPYSNIKLYEMAFTHRSYTNEHPSSPCYDRLEFLGDSVLDMVVGQLVYEYYSDSNSGVLTKARSALVDSKTLSELAESKEFDFPPIIRYSEGERGNVLHHNKIHEDVFESFIGALFLDQGYEYTKSFLAKVFSARLKDAFRISRERDSKSHLQELLNGVVIEYQVVNQVKNENETDYEVHARLDDNVLGVGFGHNIKEAEINAAKDALAKKVGD